MYISRTKELKNVSHIKYYVGSGGRAVERRTFNRGDGGSFLSIAVSKLRQFRSPYICLCLSEETLKAGVPFYVVSMPAEVKEPAQGVNVKPVVDSPSLEKDNSCVCPRLGCL